MLSDLMVRQAKATGKPHTFAGSDGLSFHFCQWRQGLALPLLVGRQARSHLFWELSGTLPERRPGGAHTERKRKRHATMLAGEHTFKAVYGGRSGASSRRTCSRHCLT